MEGKDKQHPQHPLGKDKSPGETYGATAADRQQLAQSIAAARTGIVLTGRVVNGKVELDQATLSTLSDQFADAEFSFVAVNAPFDPQTADLAAVE
ncbi:MAG TPA: hypothetical protein VK399_07500 [Longimicrobiaceae bacterium]|nr:hypothetical protein [Longimicrobiaceae bacterium]